MLRKAMPLTDKTEPRIMAANIPMTPTGNNSLMRMGTNICF